MDRSPVHRRAETTSFQQNLLFNMTEKLKCQPVCLPVLLHGTFILEAEVVASTVVMAQQNRKYRLLTSQLKHLLYLQMFRSTHIAALFFMIALAFKPSLV